MAESATLTCRRCENAVPEDEVTCYEKWGRSREWVAKHIDTYICRDCLWQVASQRGTREGGGKADSDDSDSGAAESDSKETTEESSISDWT